MNDQAKTSNQWGVDDIPNQQGRVAIVTGANTGIGYETARILALKGAHVVMACRNETKAIAAKSRIQSEYPDAKIEIGLLDLSHLKSVSEFADSFKQSHNRLDLLINNAGVMAMPFQRTEDGFELQFATNYLGHFALTGQLLEIINQTDGARIVSLSSLAHRKGKIDFSNLNAEKNYHKMKSYAQTKLACLMFAYELQRRLESNNLTTLSVAAHPGVTHSELVDHTFFLKLLAKLSQPTLQGALPTLRAATDPSVKGGEYYGPDGFQNFRGWPAREQSIPVSYDEKAAQELWRVSGVMTGVYYLTGN